MSERKQTSRSDWLGIALFALGSFGAVLMLRAMSTTGPLEQQGPFGQYAAQWKSIVGVFPSLFLNAAIAFLGARLFLEIGRKTLVRNALGCAGLAVALAVICGAWKVDAGGWIGARTGAVVTEYTHVAVGTLVGLLSFFAAAWFAWFRTSAIAEMAIEEEAPVAAVIERPAAKVAVRPAVSRPVVANEGVSPAESAALFPEDDEPVVVKKLTPDELARVSLVPFPNQEIPPSPYPEDVRRKGQIPLGARPLENPNGSTTTQSPVPAPAVYRWTAPREERADDGARADLAETPAAAEPEIVEREEAPELSAIEARLPVASWEEAPVQFQPEEGDEEPVDAYGTPLTLVEKLRRARREGGLESYNAMPLVEGDAIEASAEMAVPREIDADIVDAPIHVQAATFDALEEELSDDEDETELEETDLLETELFGANDAADDADLEDDKEEIVEVIAELEPEPEPEPEVAIEPPARPAKIAEVQPSLFDAVAVAKPIDAPKPIEVAKPAAKPKPIAATKPAPTPKPVETEREVVLQPVAAQAPVDRTPKPSAIDGDARINQLSEIGCLFIERGRVAVSMLQRQYEMDFDEACKVLDDLQEMGLIGPYLGGQRRDILLTREQWLERVSQASAAR